MITAEYLDKEIENYKTQIAEKEQLVKKLQIEIENANNDRNALYGALQQCAKIKDLLDAEKSIDLAVTNEEKK
jgi:hypothetical protein